MSVHGGQRRLSRCSQLDALIPSRASSDQSEDMVTHDVSCATEHCSNRRPQKPSLVSPLGIGYGFAASVPEEVTAVAVAAAAAAARHERPGQPPHAGGPSTQRPFCFSDTSHQYTPPPPTPQFTILTPKHSPKPIGAIPAASTAAKPQEICRPPSPASDKEATSPSHSCLPEYLRSSHTPVVQTDWSDKEAIVDPSSLRGDLFEFTNLSESHSGSFGRPHPSPDPDQSSIFSNLSISSSTTSALESASSFGQPLAYTDTTLAFTEYRPSDLTMKYFRRRPQSQALSVAPSIAQTSAPMQENDFTSRSSEYTDDTYNQSPPSSGLLIRGESVSTMNEKRTLGPQDTGIVHANGQVGFGFGVQDDGKQSVQPYDHSISGQITLARTTRVRAVVDAYVEPILRQQASNGMAQTTLVLVPEVAVNPDSVLDYGSSSDPLGLSSPDSKRGGDVKKLEADVCRLLSRQEAAELLVGFPAEHSLRVVRLAPAHSGHTGYSGDDRARFGDEGSRFWQQGPVVTELDRLLRIRLVDMGLDVQDPTGSTAAHRKAGWLERGESVGTGLPAATDLGRRIKLERERENGFGASPRKWNGKEWDAGVGIWSSSGIGREQASWQAKPQQTLLPGQASVAVSLEDVCFRTENAMGLFETKTDQAVVVSIRIEV